MTTHVPLWFHEERAYAVVVARGAAPHPMRSGLSHVDAMLYAETLQLEGEIASVMHVVDGASFEVDRYPPR